ncbi:unnamed protein product [Adineta ricciae]|uniref:Uncharacterized protein n=1 Tax=Adineta ricciae TaxID=249248 RepID=A0A815FY51_ADIRI|nr:unnamed protein product [Adineta ricciae]
MKLSHLYESKVIPTFVRPNGDTNQLYYYHAISVRIFMTGVYTFTSKSEIDTYGSLHNDAVDLSNPSKSMIVYDDDSGDGSQFRISRDLQSVEGPASVILTENFHLISESTTHHQLCGSCETPYSPDDKSSTKAIVAIVVPICSLTSLEHNQIIRRRRSSLGNIQITATITNAIDVPFTVPLARVFESLEEEQPPPPPYTSVIPYSRA